VLSMPTTNQAVVVADNGTRLVLLDLQTRQRRATFSLGHEVSGLGLSPGGGLLWVSLRGTGELLAVETAAFRRLAALPIPDGPHCLIPSPDNQRVYVLTHGEDSLAVVETASGAVRHMAHLGKQPARVDISSDGRWLYLSSWDDNALLVVSAADLAVVAKVPVGKEPYTMSKCDGSRHSTRQRCRNSWANSAGTAAQAPAPLMEVAVQRLTAGGRRCGEGSWHAWPYACC